MLDIKYLAGVFDSDGSFSINRRTDRGYISYRPLVQLTWKFIPETKQILDQLKEEYGGSVFFDKSRRKLAPNNMYLAYKLDGRNCYAFIDAIKDHLIIKKKQALICLEVINLLGKPGQYNKGHARPKELLMQMEELYIACWQQNKYCIKTTDENINYKLPISIPSR